MKEIKLKIKKEEEEEEKSELIWKEFFKVVWIYTSITFCIGICFSAMWCVVCSNERPDSNDWPEVFWIKGPIKRILQKKALIHTQGVTI